MLILSIKPWLCWFKLCMNTFPTLFVKVTQSLVMAAHDTVECGLSMLYLFFYLILLQPLVLKETNSLDFFIASLKPGYNLLEKL